MAAANLRLYTYWRSSCSYRVRIALAHKGLLPSVEQVPVHLVRDGGEQHAPGYVEMNAFRQVPTLLVGDTPLTQSMAIMEYLEEAHPTPPLLPPLSEPLQRGRVRQFAEMINSGIQPLQNLAMLMQLKEQGVDHTAWAADVIHKGLVGLEALASETTQGGGGGRYAVGDAPTLADACLVPQIYNARRFGLDIVAGSGDYPTLGAVEAACAELPAFQQAHPDVQPDADA